MLGLTLIFMYKKLDKKRMKSLKFTMDDICKF